MRIKKKKTEAGGATGWATGERRRKDRVVGRLRWKGGSGAGRPNAGVQRWSCSQSGQDLRARGGYPSSALVPTSTLAFQALIFHMISSPPVLRLALALQTVCVTVPFSAGKNLTETCFITVDLMVSRMSREFVCFFLFFCFLLCSKGSENFFFAFDVFIGCRLQSQNNGS